MLCDNYKPSEQVQMLGQVGRTILVAFIRGRLRRDESCKVYAILDRCPMWRDLVPDIYYGETKTYQNALRHQPMGEEWREPISFSDDYYLEDGTPIFMQIENSWKPLRYRPRMDNKLTVLEYCLYVEVGTEFLPSELFQQSENLIYNRKLFLYNLAKTNLAGQNVVNIDDLISLKCYHGIDEKS